MYKGYLTDVHGIRVGHYHDDVGLTGVTVVLPPENTVCGVDVRGGAPGTRETDLLKPENFVTTVHGILLAGGSAFGLDAAAGMMEFLEERDIGLDVGVTKVPIVPGAVIFDLACGDFKARPKAEDGYNACSSASVSELRQGNVGAGMGATVGKAMGPECSMKSGLGSATLKSGDLIVSALTICNAFGDVFDHEQKVQIAGVYDRKTKTFGNTLNILESKLDYNAFQEGKNTTISVVATNGAFDKASCNKIASMAQNGYANSIYPVHTMFDGDTIFALATGEVKADVSLVGALASKVIARAVANSIYHAKSIEGFTAFPDI